MGFFSTLFGGSQSKSSNSSGYGALPKVAQDAMDAVTKEGSAMLLGGNGASLFTPLATTDAEKQAYSLMQTPTTAAGVTSLANTYMNPFTSFITDALNKEAAGKYSLYNSALADAGQFGSNRQFLNASAQDEARLNSIGNAMAGQWNTALNTGLSQNQQTIANLLAQGEQERSLYSQTKQSGLTALQQMAALLGVYPATSEGTSKSSSQNGIFSSMSIL